LARRGKRADGEAGGIHCCHGLPPERCYPATAIDERAVDRRASGHRLLRHPTECRANLLLAFRLKSYANRWKIGCHGLAVAVLRFRDRLLQLC
jgi:hypothetical protein